MACRLFGAKQLPESWLTNCQFGPEEQAKFESKYEFFIHENAFEFVICEEATILSRGEMSYNISIESRIMNNLCKTHHS